MRNVNVLGLLFPNQHDDRLGELTAHRSMGSVPFGGRYRLIDFVLSNMVNAGITKVGVATKSHYQSLMDHLGSGKPWDLDRKNGGLFFLPTHVSDTAYAGRIAALNEMQIFLRNSKEEYVLLSDCHVVGNIDYDPLIRQHIETGADVTVAYCKGGSPCAADTLLLRMLEDGELTDIRVGQGDGAFGIGLYVIRRELLLRLVGEAYSLTKDSFERDILQHRLGELRLYGYEVTEYAVPIASLAEFFDANMALLRPQVRRQLFRPDRRIYTKVRDCAPAIYGLHADVTDSLLADGAVVDGQVSRCILFRDVKVGRGVTLSDCILMQGSEVDADAALTHVICDKNVRVQSQAVLQGVAHYPVYIRKGTQV